jgi:uncharacterized protein (DUF2147 family)
MMRALRLTVLCFLFCIASVRQALAQSKDAIERYWYDEAKTAKILIYKAEDGKYYGRIAWLKNPERDGVPKTDHKNPDKRKRSNPLMGLVILKGFTKKGTSAFEGGSIYDPNNGKTYSCIMTHKGEILEVRGYIGISMFGRTAHFTAAE